MKTRKNLLRHCLLVLALAGLLFGAGCRGGDAAAANGGARANFNIASF